MSNTYKKVLIIGSGAVVIGQGSEFDYSAVQAVKAFKEEGIEVVVVNSNPASVMTDKGLADAVYVEPLNIDIVKRVIELEKPDCILPTMGGDKGLEIGIELYQNGCLAEKGIDLLSFNPETLGLLRSRQDFKEFLAEVGEPSAASKVVGNVENAVRFAGEVGYPVILRPAYSLGGSGIVSCADEEELRENAEKQLEISLMRRILVEKCIFGWKEIEYEVVRDSEGACACVSNLENIDPVGIHTGDSMIVLPAQTLSENESAALQASALKIAEGLKVVGSCNVQFAIKGDGSEYAVLEVDLRVGRSSALVSKATGYPIARVAAKLSLGYKLSDIPDTVAPVTDYCAVKLPKWSFEKFDDADRTLGTSMQSTGEAFALGTSFESALMKAIRSLDPRRDTPGRQKYVGMSTQELIETVEQSDDERMFAVYEAIRRSTDYKTIYNITKIDPWYYEKFKNIADIEKALGVSLDKELYLRAKRAGFLDSTIKRLSGCAELPETWSPCYAAIDTSASKPYFYASCDGGAESISADSAANGTKKVLVVGNGAASVGSGAELDYCNCSFISALKKLGYYVVAVNDNPEAVSTDFYHSDRLFIEPSTPEDVADIVSVETPWAVISQFSGKHRAPMLEKVLSALPVKLLDAGFEYSELFADDEKLFAEFDKIEIPYTRETFFNSTVIEADAISDGKDFLLPGIVEHVERSGINAGDAIAVYPTLTVDARVKEKAVACVGKIVAHFGIKGLVNVKFKLYDNILYVTHISLYDVYNLPFIIKATGLPVPEIALRCMLGESLADIGFGTGHYPFAGKYAVKVPVFSFDKLAGADILLGDEMKSTGEVMGLAMSFEDALLKALSASGMRIKRSGGVLVTVRNSDKQAAIAVADKFSALDFNIYATAGTAKTLNENFVATNSVRKIHEGSPHTLDLINSGKVVYVISTSEKDSTAQRDDVLIRRRSVERQIPTFTALETAVALTRCLRNKRSLEDIELINIGE